MKRYKLLQVYPGVGLTVGSIVEKVHHMYSYESADDTPTTYSAYIVENHPEFWQEVKDFPKITSFRINDPHSSPFIAELCENGKYCTCTGIKEGNHTLNEMLHEGNCVDSGFIEIYQVQVESGEVFTLGDKIKGDLKTPEIIKRFGFLKNELVIYPEHSFFYRFKDVVKESPLLTTEDGVDIYTGHRVYFVDAHFKPGFSICFPDVPVDTSRKYFSTKEAAEKWINEPMFSRKDILDVLEEVSKPYYEPAWKATLLRKFNL